MHYIGGHYDADELIESLMEIRSDGGNIVQIFITGNKNKYTKEKIDVCKNNIFIIGNSVLYDMDQNKFILINYGFTDNYIRRILIKKNILIVKEPIFYYVLSSIKSLKKRFIINEKSILFCYIGLTI